MKRHEYNLVEKKEIKSALIKSFLFSFLALKNLSKFRSTSFLFAKLNYELFESFNVEKGMYLNILLLFQERQSQMKVIYLNVYQKCT